MSAAVFGLIGVAVGALVAGGVDLTLERSRERKATRGALRLLRTDLDRAAAMLKTSIAREQWWPAPFVLPTSIWEGQRDLLSTGVKETNDWDAISRACVGLQDLGGFHAALKMDANADNPAYSAQDSEKSLGEVLQKVNAAFDAIDRQLR
jgi:hypothetical protein